VALPNRRIGRQIEQHAQVRRASTLDDPDWNNTTVIRGDVVSGVAKLRKRLNGQIVAPANRQLVH
jgi:hypothetical protein